MKLNPGFRLRTVLDQKVVVGEGATQINFNKLISLNPTAALLWETAEAGEFTIDTLAQALVDKYDIDMATAKADVADIVDKWVELGLATR